MRALNYILVGILMTVSCVMSPELCHAQRHRDIARETLPDSLSRTYRNSEAVKYLSIHGDTVKARAIWEELIAEDSTYSPALYYLYMLETDERRALDYIKRAYMADTTNRWYARGYASGLVATHRYSEAIPAYRRLMHLAPNDIEAYHALAILYSYGGMPYSAISILDSAELRTGYNPYLGEMKLQLLLDTRQYDRAVETGLRGVMEQPYDSKAHVNLADAYERAGRDSLALRSLEEAVRLDVTNVAALTALSSYYERKGDMQSMLDNEERIIANPNVTVSDKIRHIELLTSDMSFYAQHYIRIGGMIQRLAIAHPNNREVIDCYAQHMIALGDLEEALEYLRRNLENEASTSEHYIEVLQLAHYLEDKAAVGEVLDAALQRYPTDIEVISFAGYLALEAKEYKRAIAIFSEGLDVTDNPEQQSELLGYVGDVYHEMGKDNKAFKQYRKALEYNRNNVLVLNNYAYFLSLLDKELEKALDMAQRAVKLESGNASYIDTLAWVLHRLGRNEEAKRVMSQALSLSAQRDASLLIHYGDILWALGESFMADTYWKKAAELGFDKKALEEHIAELKSKSKSVKHRK